MNDLLKKDLEKLLEAHPELKNSRVDFSDPDFSFAGDIAHLGIKEDDNQSVCKIKEEPPVLLKGTPLK